MATINCSVPLKLRLRGEPSEDEWVELENKLVSLYVRAIERSLRELAKSQRLEQEPSSATESMSTIR